MDKTFANKCPGEKSSVDALVLTNSEILDTTSLGDTYRNPAMSRPGWYLSSCVFFCLFVVENRSPPTFPPWMRTATVDTSFLSPFKSSTQWVVTMNALQRAWTQIGIVWVKWVLGNILWTMTHLQHMHMKNILSVCKCHINGVLDST